MTQEEKAKAYDEALKVLHKYDGANIMFTQDLKEEMFPELKESEDEIVIAALKSGINGLLKKEYHLKGIGGISFDRINAWLEKKGEQKPAWSEEDENNINTLGSIVFNDCNAEDASRLITWLNDIKDRVLPRPKQEWSKEDEHVIDKLLNTVTLFNPTSSIFEKLPKEQFLERLKSLKERFNSL